MMGQVNGTLTLWRAEGAPGGFEGLRGDVETDVVVVGAGLAGVATAVRLVGEGARVLLVDARQPGAGETGRTSAHLAPVPDDGLAHLLDLHGRERVAQLCASQAAAVDWVEALVHDEGLACDFERVPGWLYATRGDAEERRDRLTRELEAAQSVGVEAELVDAPDYDPFNAGIALRYARQAVIHPLKLLHELLARPADGRLTVAGETRVLEVDEQRHGVVVRCANGASIRAEACAVTTNTPFADRVSTHVRQAPYRTFVVALPVDRAQVPAALLWDDEEPYHYVRPVQTGEGRTLLLVGGEDHKVGQADDGAARLDRLERWARSRFDVIGERVWAWSGQIFEPADGIGFNGRVPGRRHTFMISGDSGDGLTNALAGSAVLTDLIAGRANPYADLYDPSRLRVRSAPTLIRENANVAKRFVTDRLRSDADVSPSDLAPGSGCVVKRGGKHVALHRDADGTLHRHSAVCPHLGCIVQWNTLESSWDCPCHGSRFERDGALITGPATEPLASLDGTDDNG